jgi:hypothetical protein
MIKVDTIAPRATTLMIPSFLAILFLTELAMAQWFHPLRIGHDQALYLQCGFLWLHGAIPYVDFVDSNPPLIIYVNSIPALISECFHVPPVLVFNLFTCCLLAISLLLCHLLMVRRKNGKEFAFYFPLLISLPLISSWLDGEFGQREHLFFILYFPFILARWFRWSGSELSCWESVPVGLLAGLGLCFKPYFIIPAAFCEVYWLIHMRTFRPLFKLECYCFLLAVVLYLLHFLFLPAAELQSYFGFIAPMYIEGYAFWDVTTIGMLAMGKWGDVFPWLIMSLMIAIYMRKRCTLLLPLAAFALGALTCYLIQNKGWNYHPIPFICASSVLALLEIWLMLSYTWQSFRFSSNLLFYSCALIAMAYTYSSFVNDLPYAKRSNQIDLASYGWPGYYSDKGDLGTFAPEILKRTSVNDRVIVISNGVQPAYPTLLQLRRWPGSGQLQALFLSIFDYISERPPTNQRQRLLKMQQHVMDNYKEDVKRYAPKLVAIQDFPLYDDVERYHFVEDSLGAYRKVGKFNGFVIYQKK